jgi:NAD(P)-dependent dehydrogenase (short-subunit alcohol dehydrogenase family)
VILACRDPQRGAAAVARINSELAESMTLDLASFESIRQFAKDFLAKDIPLHVLVNNACPMVDSFVTTTDGHEMMYGAGHLGPFLLTSLLIDKIKASGVSRIVTLTSTAMITGSKSVADYPLTDPSKFGKLKVYSETKLANALFAMELSRRLATVAPNVLSVCVHPGIVETNLSNSMMPGIFFTLVAAFKKNERQGAATTCFAATHHSIVSGTYYEDSDVAKATSLAYSEKLAKQVWTQCERVIGISFLSNAEHVEANGPAATPSEVNPT